ncbi:MAG: hypothetical protein WA885_15005 [Phormidesmis sp.]
MNIRNPRNVVNKMFQALRNFVETANEQTEADREPNAEKETDVLAMGLFSRGRGPGPVRFPRRRRS